MMDLWFLYSTYYFDVTKAFQFFLHIIVPTVFILLYFFKKWHDTTVTSRLIPGLHLLRLGATRLLVLRAKKSYKHLIRTTQRMDA